MSFRRFAVTFGVEFGHSFRRPLFLILAALLALTAFGLSSGSMSITSGDSSVGGTKAWITSEYAQTETWTYLTILFLCFFIAVSAGMTLLRDRETQVDAILHATPLTASEYVWGRFTAIVVGMAVMFVFYAAVASFFNHVMPSAAAKEIRGPFVPANYLLPVATIGIPFLVFFTGLSMYVGEKSRSPVLVFIVPVAFFIVCGFLLLTWSPSWLSASLNRVLQAIDPSGYRWLNETHLKVDRGVDFYNHQHVHYDALFWLNRTWLLLIGVVSVFATQRSVSRSARGIARRRERGAGREPTAPGARAAAVAASPEPGAAVGVSGLGMASGTAGFWDNVRGIAGAELRELSRQPGLYIFVPIILLQILGNALVAVGAFDTPLLMTPGINAVAASGQLTVAICLLLIYYIVESFERDRRTGIAPILYASPLRTGALLLGKSLANLVVIGIIIGASLVAGLIVVLVQGTVPFSIVPYALVWGLLLLPTFLAWMAFVTFLYAATGSRLGAIGLALGALALSGFRALTGHLNWAWNWPLWNALRWSDLGFFETDRAALVWNRVMVLGLAVLFGALAVRLFARRGADAVRTMHALAPRQLARAGIRLLPMAGVPIVACVVLVFLVHDSIDGPAARKERKDYWAKNLKTWMNAPLPDIARVDISLRLDPARHGLRSEGRFTLVNSLDTTIARVPLTGALSWDSLSWTMNGEPYAPEDRKRLYVFTPPSPLAKGDSVTIGWMWKGHFPAGVTKNGGNTDEFVLPSGVVLTGFTPSFMPVLGFMEDIGETKENKTEPRQYPRDYWKGVTRAAFNATSWFPARVTVTAPAEYTLNSEGICTKDEVSNGWRTQVWETDHPVKLLNVVCGRWKVRRGHGTAIYYDAAHPYNIDEMSATLDAARRYYSEWFLPYPWKELKLSEFPALAGYAQGFGTNITFSENIGFLTKNDEKTNATFLVTAHESAHQWWGNILTPADGPGGDILSEGMSHFSTLLLFEQVKGPRGRMEFAKGIEARYADRRRPDDERPMYDIDGKRASDETVTYDRGGWVFWMLYDFMGHERALDGYRHFIRTWSVSRDHPALQDFVAAMRPFAPDSAAYDAFTRQWFEEKAMPEYRITKATKRGDGDGFDVVVTVTNRGTGRMPVEIAATAGERWPKQGTRQGEGVDAEPSGPAPGSAYRESRGTLTLGSGGSGTITIHCPFEPKQVVVDPDVRVLQLNRKLAVASL